MSWWLLDCRPDGGRIWGYEEGSRFPQDLSLADWFHAWLTGTLALPDPSPEHWTHPDASEWS